MQVKAESADRRLRLRLYGELDHHAARQLMKSIADELEYALPLEVILDFSGVTFMDSSGIALILRSQQRMQLMEGSVVLRNVPEQARRVLDAAGIGRLVSIQ